MGIRKIKVGDRVVITASLEQYSAHVYALDEHVGQTGEVLEVNDRKGQCDIIFDNDDTWWYSYSTVRHVDDDMGITLENIKTNLAVVIHDLSRLYLKLGITHERDGNDRQYDFLHGVNGHIVSDPTFDTIYDKSRNAYFVDVKCTYGTLSLPMCALRLHTPTYNPKKIKICQ